MNDDQTEDQTYEQISDLCSRRAEEAFLQRLRKDIEQIFRPTLDLLLCRRSDLLDMLEVQENRVFFDSLQGILREISVHNLRPWQGSSTTKANRENLKSEGGLEIILQLYSLLLKLPLPSWDTRDKLLQKVETRILYFLWNFSETAEERKLVVDMGAFDMMLQSLMHSEEEFRDNYTINGLCYVAIGCLSNWCVMEYCQTSLAQNTPVLHRLLQFALNGPSEGLFTKVLIAKSCLRVSHRQHTHQYITKPAVIKELISFFNSLGDAKVEEQHIVQYILGLMYARLILFSSENIEETFLQEMTEHMKSFLLQVKQCDLYKYEEENQYHYTYWITMLPFLDTAYTNGVEIIKFSSTCLKISESSETFFEEISCSSTVTCVSAAKSVSLAYVYSLLSW